VDVIEIDDDDDRKREIWGQHRSSFVLLLIKLKRREDGSVWGILSSPAQSNSSAGDLDGSSDPTEIISDHVIVYSCGLLRSASEFRNDSGLWFNPTAVEFEMKMQHIFRSKFLNGSNTNTNEFTFNQAV
jgi:hypothetical protein